MAKRPWRVAKSLDKMRTQVNVFAPNRAKQSDGTIGDAAHSAVTSDHNPNSAGVVTALDLTHSPTRGFDSYAFAENLRLKRDSRVKYVISNHRIFSATVNPWTWRRYTGSNPHSSHVHVSVSATAAQYDSARDWDLGFGVGGGVADQRPILRRGATGLYVFELQGLLGDVQIDGSFGELTEASVKRFQQRQGLVPDGVVGDSTWKALDPVKEGQPDPDSPANRPILRRGSKGELVREVQTILGIRVDGDFGPATETAVRDFQHGKKLQIDGVVGERTWTELDKIEQLPAGEGVAPRIFEAPLEIRAETGDESLVRDEPNEERGAVHGERPDPDGAD